MGYRKWILLPLASLLLGAAAPPSLTVSPTPTRVGDVVEFAGCGYTRSISLFVEEPDGTRWGFSTGVHASGCFNTATNDVIPAFVPSTPGTYETYIYPKTGSGTGTYGHHKALLDQDFEVTP